MRYVDWDALREELFFTESEERAITKRAAELTNNRELAERIAKAVAEVDSSRWGVQIPDPDHPFWQVYVAYGEAVMKVLQGGSFTDGTGFETPPAKVEVGIPQSSDDEIDAAFKSAAVDSCAEGNHLFCQPGCQGQPT